ncbi:hypothetical protein RUND412_006026 [Rhizina undulata]
MRIKSIIFAALQPFGLVLGHGYVSDFVIDGKYWRGFSPYYDRGDGTNPVPARISYSLENNRPVHDVLSANITCNYNPEPGRPAQLTAPARAGSNMTLTWTPWPNNHFGAILTYMAWCNGDCRSFNAMDGAFFKIHQQGLLPDGTWITESFIANNSTLTVALPSDIRSGQYLVRHEQISLHAVDTYGAEIETIGGGDVVPEGVKFPGAYSPTDPGFTFNMTTDAPPYIFPGPSVYNANKTCI